MKILRQVFVVVLLVCGVNSCAAQSVPKCDGVGQWPASMAFVQLKNAGVVDNEMVNFSKTTVALVASNPGDHGVFRQVHRVAFQLRSGDTLQVLTVSDATAEECSMGEVSVFIDLNFATANMRQ